jgi:nicotinamide riboside transporter PnuC
MQRSLAVTAVLFLLLGAVTPLYFSTGLVLGLAALLGAIALYLGSTEVRLCWAFVLCGMALYNLLSPQSGPVDTQLSTLEFLGAYLLLEK